MHLDSIALIRDELLLIEKALVSLQTVSDAQWQSLGATVATQATSSITLCKGFLRQI